MMFALFMLVVLVITGAIWLLDVLILKKRRAAGAAAGVGGILQELFPGETSGIPDPFIYR